MQFCAVGGDGYNGDIMRRAILSAVVVAMAAGVALAGHHRQYAQLSFVVVKDANGQPVSNAAVVLHPVKKNGDQAEGGMELKTDMDGKTAIDGIPYGKMRVQVIAPRLKTFGQDYDINQPNVAITIKLVEPTGQYSIYK